MRGCEMGFFDNKTVTLFNRAFDPETEEEKYYPTLLEGVDLVETKGANVSKSGMDSADAVKLYVDFGNIAKPYLPPKEWETCRTNASSTFGHLIRHRISLSRGIIRMQRYQRTMPISGCLITATIATG